MTDSSAGDWAPSAEDFTYVGSVNRPYVKSLGDGEAGTWQIGGSLVLLGDGLNATYADWVRAQPDYASGTFEVERATIGAGKLIFTGVGPSQQDAVKSAVGEFSSKAVEFG